MRTGIHSGPSVGRSISGFTLVELMVIVAIVALLAAIAIPNYTSFVERSRRSEAREGLADLASRQEQFYLNNKSYSDSIADLGRSGTSEKGFYTFSIPVSTTTTWEMRAVAAGPQTKDTPCLIFELTNTGNKTPVECWD